MLKLNIKRFIVVSICIFSINGIMFSKDLPSSHTASKCNVICSESGIYMMIATSLYYSLEYSAKISQYEGLGMSEVDVLSLGFPIFKNPIFRNDYPNLYLTIISYMDINITNKYGEFTGGKLFPWGEVESSIPYYMIQDSLLIKTICSDYDVNDSLVNVVTPFLIDFASDLERNKCKNGFAKVLPYAYDCVDKQSRIICRSFNWLKEKIPNVYDSINIVINPFGFHRINLEECDDSPRILTIVGCLPYFEEDSMRCEFNTFDMLAAQMRRKTNKGDESLTDVLGICYYLDYCKTFYENDLYEKERERIMRLIDKSAPDPNFYKNYLKQYKYIR